MTDAPKPNGAATVGGAGDAEGTSAELPRWVSPAIVVIVAGGTGFYLWLVFTRWRHAEQWGDFGGAVGPFVGLLNAGALFAALYSVRLQRRELELQRQELRETRREMVEQRKHFEKTAAAQEELARSTRHLADAQRDANRLAKSSARDAEIAQRCANIAVLQTAVANVQIAIHTSGLQANVAAKLGQKLANLAGSLYREMKRLKELGLDLGAPA